jgi:hypothetical protein
MYEPHSQARSRLIEMVADGDVHLVGIDYDGPRFEFTNKGAKHRSSSPTARLLAKHAVWL